MGGDGRERGLFGHLGGCAGKRCGFEGLSGNARRRGTKLRRKRFQLTAQGIAFRKQRLDVAGDRGDVEILLSGVIRALFQGDHPFIETAQGFLQPDNTFFHFMAAGRLRLRLGGADGNVRHSHGHGRKRPIRAVLGRFRQRLGNIIRRYGRGQRF